MAQANPGSSSERKPARRTSPNSSAARSAGSARSSPSRSGKTSDSKPESSRSRAKSAGRRAASSKGTANASRRRPSPVSPRNRASSLGRASGNGEESKVNASKAPVVAGLATAAAGLVGGAILGTRLAGRRKPRSRRTGARHWTRPERAGRAGWEGQQAVQERRQAGR